LYQTAAEKSHFPGIAGRDFILEKCNTKKAGQALTNHPAFSGIST
jgi:hypothetical protein